MFATWPEIKRQLTVNKRFIPCTMVLLSLTITGKAQGVADTVSGKRVHTLGEVVVTGTRNETDIRHLPMTVSVVNRSQIEQRNESSLLPLLNERIPGLFTTSRGLLGYGVSGGVAGQMSLRGVGGPAQPGVPTTGLLVLIDGHPQYMGLFAHPISDSYQPFMTERVEVLRGPASVLYGSNAMGGVINIVTRKIRENGVKTHANIGYGSYNTLQSEITSRIMAGQFTGMAGVSYNRTDGHRSNMEFEQYSGYAKCGFRLSETWNLHADINLIHFNASNPGEVTDPLIDNDQRITRGMASFVVENNYKVTSGALSLFHNWGNHWINDGYNTGGQPLDYRFKSRDNMSGLSLYQSVQLFPGNRLTAGADYFHFGGESWNKPVAGGERQPQVDRTQNEAAGYMDFRQTLNSWLTLDAGIRIDHHSHVGTEWIPQAGLSFGLPGNAEIKVMASKGFRYPTVRELYMFRPANPDLKPERLWNYEIACSQLLSEGTLSYGVNIFYIDGENLIMRMPVDGQMKNVNTGEIENSGIEMQIACRLSPAWTADANYSYLHMKQPVLASPEHKLYAGIGCSKERWSVSTGVQYVAGLYTDVKVGNTGNFTKENFVLWNVRGDFRVSRWLQFWLRGENLLAQRYEINAGFPMPKATVMTGVNLKF